MANYGHEVSASGLQIRLGALCFWASPRAFNVVMAVLPPFMRTLKPPRLSHATIACSSRDEVGMSATGTCRGWRGGPKVEMDGNCCMSACLVASAYLYRVPSPKPGSATGQWRKPLQQHFRSSFALSLLASWTLTKTRPPPGKFHFATPQARIKQGGKPDFVQRYELITTGPTTHGHRRPRKRG